MKSMNQQQPSKGREGAGRKKHRFVGDARDKVATITIESIQQDDETDMEFERDSQGGYNGDRLDTHPRESISQQEDQTLPTPITIREQHFDDDSSQYGLKAQARMLITPNGNYPYQDETMSLISDATIIFNNTESAVGAQSVYEAGGLLAAASNLFHQQQHQSRVSYLQTSEMASLMLMGATRDGALEDITTAQNNNDQEDEVGPCQLSSTYIEQPSQFSDSADPRQGDISGGQSVQLSRLMPRASPSKEKASKAKHELRRQNLRKKRVQEQIMQVVEGFIRDETIVTTMQAYVEANFLNDMMNTSHEIVGNVIHQELRRVIREVLSDIYFAHTSSLFVENFITAEMRHIAQEALESPMHRQECETSMQYFEESQDDYFHSTSAIQVLDYEECDATFTRTEDQIMACPSQQVIHIQQVVYQSTGNLGLNTSPSEDDVQLSNDVVTDALCGFSQQGHLADKVLISLADQLVSTALSTLAMQTLAHSRFQPIVLSTLKHGFLNQIQTSVIQDIERNISDTLVSKRAAAVQAQRRAFEAQRRAREGALLRMAMEQVMMDVVDRETTAVFKGEVESEYFTRYIYEEIVGGFVERQTVEVYEDELIAECIGAELVDQEIITLCEDTQREGHDSQQAVIQVASELADAKMRELQLDVVLDLILEDFLQVFAATTVTSKCLDEHLLCEDLFDDLLTCQVRKLAGFTLQLERDADLIFQALISSQLTEDPIVNEPSSSPPLTSKEEEIQTDLTLQVEEKLATDAVALLPQSEIGQLRILRETSTEDAKRYNDRYGKRAVPAKGPSHAVISLRDSVDEEIAIQSYLGDLLTRTLSSSLQALLTSLLLPHLLYKRILTRTLRKSTYSAIQQAVDLAYRLEEDTINVADALLDRFVEGQIREMVMVYPGHNRVNQRRSHTILIDASEDKGRIMGKLQQIILPQYETAEGGGAAPGRRQKNSMAPMTQASLFNQKRHSINEVLSPQEGFGMNHEEGRYTHHKNQSSMGKPHEIVSQPVMMRKYHQTMPNQRYNNQHVTKASSSLGTTSQPFQEEELPSTTMHMLDVHQASVHFTHHATQQDISFQQVAPTPINTHPYQQNGLHQRDGGKSVGSSIKETGVGLDQMYRSITSSQDTRVLPVQEAHFRSLRGLEKKKRSLERLKGSMQSSENGGYMDPVEDVEIPAGHLGKLVSPRISEQFPSSDRGGVGETKRAPKEGFRFIESKNSQLAASQRSQETLQVYNPLMMQTQDTRNANPLSLLTTSNIVYRPQVNQFDTFSSSSPPGAGGMFSQTKNIPHVSLTLVTTGSKPSSSSVYLATQKKAVHGIAQGRSPKNHGRYFNEATEIKSVAKPSNQDDAIRGRSTSNKRAVIDLRGAMAQIQTAQKAIQPLLEQEGAKQVFNQGTTKHHQVDLRDPRTNASMQGQRPNSALGPAHSLTKTVPYHHQTLGAFPNLQQPIITDTSVKTQLQQLIMVLKGRVAECKSRSAQHSNNLMQGGPSTSLLMTQLACDVLHSLAEQVLSVSPQKDPLIDLRDLNLEDSTLQQVSGRIREEEEQLTEHAKCREQLFAIDKKIKELVMKLQQNQTLMSKQDFQLCMLQANQLAMLNCQKLTLIMREDENNTQSFESINFPAQQHHPQQTVKAKGKQNIQPQKYAQTKSSQMKSQTSLGTGSSGVSTPNVSSFLKNNPNPQPLQMRQLNYSYAQQQQVNRR